MGGAHERPQGPGLGQRRLLPALAIRTLNIRSVRYWSKLHSLEKPVKIGLIRQDFCTSVLSL